ncbi:response regulator [Curvibacter sp. APW13]|uniref:ANTAR domain-containing response regulator n=1 Tax=Curvibacter sp. APW13 TaxID=3077236 RepID=UPI0028DDD144|nr:response regulator [Curvibacter sp. APW13]MDT8992305.1 response regulator [Curvibacter sp. APW13]
MMRPIEMNQEHAVAGKHVLLVEDDRLVLATVAQGLREAGYQVEATESAEDAQEWLAKGARPDLAVVDMCMPGADGLSLAQRLRDLDRIPFMVFSAYGDAEHVDQAAALGALAYLVKPLDVAQLIPVIETALVRAAELNAMRSVNSGLQSALDGERDISVATGLAMAYHRISRERAFEMLRSNARSGRRKLVDMARSLIASHLSDETPRTNT